MEAQKAGAEASSKPPEPQVSTPTTSVEAPKPANAEPPTEAPKAEAVPNAEAVAKPDTAAGLKHVVVKGETLTSIAKHYNIAIAELKNANKIGDERKLQIGQILSVPTPKPSESPEKKENP